MFAFEKNKNLNIEIVNSSEKQNQQMKGRLQMKKNYYETELNIRKNTTFGGVIYPSDFEPEQKKERKKTGSDIARRIISDWNFDKQCEKNIRIREQKNNPDYLQIP